MSNKSEFYCVDGTNGSCTCPIGKLGKFCKHQAAVYFYFDNEILNAPPVTNSRYSMAKLAFGEKVQPISFYEPLQSTVNKSSDPPEILNEKTISVNVNSQNKDICDADGGNDADDRGHNVESSSDAESFDMVVKLLREHHMTFGTSCATKQKVIKRLKSIKTKTSWESFLNTAGSSISLRHRTNLTIKVQPTSISRRKVGTTRGCKRLTIGRPPKEEPKPRKRKRNLAANVAKNQTNAKSHGTGH